jgi:hypothetical protein
LSALFEEKVRVIDARIAELTALRADLDARVGTGCPLRATGRADLRFPRDAECVDRKSDGTHERNIDHGCPQEVLAGVA